MDHSDNFTFIIRSDVGKPAFPTHWSACVTQKFVPDPSGQERTFAYFSFLTENGKLMYMCIIFT